MMLKSMILLIILYTSVLLSAVTLTVRQDGLGNYVTIQAAIDASSDGDIVLVSPGRYLENIDFSGKNITVASLKFTTGDPLYIGTTIIDGRRLGSCVKVSGGETSARIIGFSITNGSGEYDYHAYDGGGIIVNQHSTLSIESCRIFENDTECGGGLFARQATVTISDTSFFDNLGTMGGGGICLQGSEVSLTMDPINRCSIYNNYSGQGTDLLCIDVPLTISVVVDTFTVINPNRYYANTIMNFYEDIYGFTFDIQQTYLTQTNHDFYVSTIGNDYNDGLSANTPYKTIAWALHNIASDSLNPKTVHIADGLYSTSLNQQRLPFSGKSFVNVVGESQENTIIDGDDNYEMMFISIACRKFNAKRMTFRNLMDEYNRCAVFGAHSTDITLEDLTISNCTTEESAAMSFTEVDDYHFTNVTISNNVGMAGISGIYMCEIQNAIFENCSFLNNQSFQVDWDGGAALRIDAIENALIRNCKFQNNFDNTQFGGAALALVGADLNLPDFRIENCLFTNNQSTYTSATYKGSPIVVSGHGQSNFINCTFADNQSPKAALLVCADSVNLWNCIFANDSPDEIFLSRPFEPNVPDNHITVNHSNIKGGIGGILNQDGWGTISWQDGNIDAIPLFNVTDKPYELTAGSPCIDAGTLDVPGGLYPYDLNGAPRVHGNSVDMGCYEYGSVDVEDDTTPTANVSLIRIYPNPFRDNAKIAFDLPTPTDIMITIYNIKGQRLKTLAAGKMSAGPIQLNWDGTDDNGKSIASGVYFCRVEMPGKSYTGKIVKIKA